MAETIDTIDDLRDRLGAHPIAMVTTADERGTLSSRPLTVQEMDMSGNVRFLVDRNADWIHAFSNAPANASFTDDGNSWVSLGGTLQIVDDTSLVERYQSTFTDAYFDEESEPVILQLNSDRVEWWTAEGRVRQLTELAKSKLTRKKPQLGESGTLDV